MQDTNISPTEYLPAKLQCGAVVNIPPFLPRIMMQCTNFPAVIRLQLCLILIPEEQIGKLPTVTEERAQGAQSAVLLSPSGVLTGGLTSLR